MDSNISNIAIISPGLANGGAEKVASILTNYFSEKGYNVFFVAVYSEKREYLLNNNIKYYFVKTDKTNRLSKLFDRNKKIYDFLLKNHVDLCISFVLNETILSNIKGIKFVYSLRIDPKHADAKFIDKKIRDYLYSKSSGIVFQTLGAKEYFSKKIQSKSTIIKNPIRVESLPFWNGINSKIFVCACRLVDQKNLPLAINAFVKIHKKHPDFSLHIYGEGYNGYTEKEKLQELINENEANEYICLKGRSTNIYNDFANSYCFVSSSNYEGLSNSMLEALCIGVPCICTDCPPGGARAVIDDGKNGFLTPVMDVNSMYEKMLYVIENKDCLNEISKNAIELRNELNVDKICKEWYDFAENALRK